MSRGKVPWNDLFNVMSTVTSKNEPNQAQLGELTLGLALKLYLNSSEHARTSYTPTSVDSDFGIDRITSNHDILMWCVHGEKSVELQDYMEG